MSQEYPAFKFALKEWYTDQMFADGDEAWFAKTIWEAAEDLPIYEVPLIGFCTDIQPWDDIGEDFTTFCKHALLVNKADLSYPIIMTPNGVIADGRHRLAKAMILGHSTIKIKRLDRMPLPDYKFDEAGNLERDDDDDDN